MEPERRITRAVLVGLGSIGRRHLVNLRLLMPRCEIIVWRHSSSEGPKESEDVQWVYDLASVLDFQPQIAILANPAPFHLPVARSLAAQNIHLFVEKPISSCFDGIVELIRECKERELVLMTGYTLRFNPSLRALRDAVADGRIGRASVIRAEVGTNLSDWRPGTDYMKSVSAQQSLGGGVVLELSHELDYVRWLGGEVATVTARLARLGEWKIDVEDTAEIILQMQSGTVASIHLNMLERPARRQCRVIGTEGTLVWDGMENSVRCYAQESEEWSIIHDAPDYDRNQMYLAELREFLQSIAERREPAITATDGLRALEVAVAAKRSHAEDRTVRLEHLSI